jgi:hypothetical protein
MELMSTDIVYREQRRTGPIAAGFAVVGFLLFVIDVATGFALQGWGVVASVFLLIIAATLWGLARYSSIRLTADRLEIGRASHAPTDFDRDFGVRTVDALTDDELALVNSPTPIPKDAAVRIIGGGWGRNLGSGVLVLRRADTKLAIITRDADRLGPLLGDWLAAGRSVDDTLPPTPR